MKQFTLRTKILFLATISLIGITFFAFMNLKQSYEEYKITSSMKESAQFLLSSSALIHEMQKERGQSSLFITNAISSDDLNLFRKNTDKKIEDFQKDLLRISLKQEQKEQVKEAVNNLSSLRQDVDKKIPTTESIPRYADIIRALLKLDGSVSLLKTTRGVGKLFTNIAIIEEAKENAGRLRASLAAILSKNAPIDIDLLGKVVMLKSGINSNLESPALSISEKSKERLKLILGSDDARKIDSVFYIVISHANAGNYGQESVVFFNIMTAYIDSINGLIHDELLSINNQIEAILDNSRFDFILTVFISLTVILFVFFVAFKISSNIAKIINSLNLETKGIIKSAKQGNLSTRANVGNVNFEFKNIVVGINDALDAIVASFNEAIKTMTELSHKNLTTKMNGDYQGDLLQLKENINKAIDELRLTIGTVSKGIQGVSSGADQVANASQSLAQGAQEQAAALEEITSTVTEISSQTQINAKNAVEVKIISEKAQNDANYGNQKMIEMISSMGKISESSEGISKIIKVIDEIAFQTNLLALNAAVEAARAGKYGKGFAVVAEEVRSLAARSAQAAKETTDLIEDSHKKVEAGVQTAKQTEDALSGIITSITQVAKLASDIAQASNAQSVGMSQISTALSQIDKVTQNNSSAAEECASSAQELSLQSNEINQQVQSFKV